MVTKSHDIICIICIICVIYNRVDRAHVPYIQEGFHKNTIVYLRTLSPYLGGSFFIVNLRIQLELICWEFTLLSILTLRHVYLYYLAPIHTPRSTSYKCPWQTVFILKVFKNPTTALFLNIVILLGNFKKRFLGVLVYTCF